MMICGIEFLDKAVKLGKGANEFDKLCNQWIEIQMMEAKRKHFSCVKDTLSCIKTLPSI